jgi:DNA repair protein RecO (recombination protein O)
MNQLQTRGIILNRTEYGEADRIITLLTPDFGKLRLMAKGVRKIKSKLAGGIELFSISDITFIRGRSEIGTLVSARLDRHYGAIVKDITRVQLGYDLIKQLNKATEDEPEAAYFQLLEQAFIALDDESVLLALIRLWFQAQLLWLAGHSPNLRTDTAGTKLVATELYDFDYDAMSFSLRPNGRYAAGHIKLLRLLLSDNDPRLINRIDGIETLISHVSPLVQTARASSMQR